MRNRKTIALMTIGAVGVLTPVVAQAAPSSTVPFAAHYEGTATPGQTIALSGSGVATALGASTNEGVATPVGPAATCPDSGFAVRNEQVFTAADGDQLHVTIEDDSCAVDASGTRFRGVGTYAVTGGTGRFSGATGSGTFEGLGDFAAQTFTFDLRGTLVRPVGRG